MFDREPVSIAARFEGDPMFARNADDKPITRDRVCECGQRFTQRLLSARFLTICEKAGAIKSVTKQIPDYFVPVHCPPCEHRDLGHQYRLDEMTIHPGSHYEPEAAD